MEHTQLQATGFKNIFTPISTHITTLVQYCYKELRFRYVISAHARLDLTNCYTAQTVQGTSKHMFPFSVIHIGSQSLRSWLALSEMAREKLVPIAVDILPQFILKEHQSTQFSW